MVPLSGSLSRVAHSAEKVNSTNTAGLADTWWDGTETGDRFTPVDTPKNAHHRRNNADSTKRYTAKAP